MDTETILGRVGLNLEAVAQLGKIDNRAADTAVEVCLERVAPVAL
jgi:hypothetical protein